MKQEISGILTGVIASAVLALFLFVIKAGLLLSLAAGALAYIASLFLFTKREKPLEFVAEGVTTDEVAAILREGREKVAAIEKTNGSIENEKVHAQVHSICKLAADIFNDLERSPKGIKTARKFLTYYLDTTAFIVGRYAELSKSAIYSDEVRAALAKVEESLSLIEETFKKQIGRLMEDDVSDLEIELELLKKTIKTEGV